ncbi:MAG: pentapeptide repeat-containing protein [Nostoc sp.]|uniref:pentapeptide repeat-containing protein n=1 Tax=Nostoc sp. TaxID=1180 RepID=UPI002FFC97A3
MDEDTKRAEERSELNRRFHTGDTEFSNKFFTPNTSTEELLKRIAAGEKEFADICLDDPNLSGINLAGANLTGAKLLSVNLSGANLEGANLSYAFLDGANLSGANLECANVAEASILGANLENANLRGTIGSFGHAHGAFYHNTIMPSGRIFVGPDWVEG